MKGFLFLCAVAIAAASGCPKAGYACHRCGRSAAQCVYKAHAVAVAPVIQYQSLNYFIGAPIRAEAAVAEALRADPAYKEFLRFKAWRDAGTPPPSTSPAAENVPAEAPPEYAAVVANCAKCHSGATPAGKITIDGTSRLSPADANRAQLAVLQGTMPKKAALTPEARGAVLADLIFLAAPPAEAKEP